MVVEHPEVLGVDLHKCLLLLRSEGVEVGLQNASGLGRHHLREVERGWCSDLLQDKLGILS